MDALPGWPLTLTCLLTATLSGSDVNFSPAPGLTHVAWGPAGCGHDATLLHLGQSKICDHDLRVLLRGEVQQVFRLQEEGTHVCLV